MAENVENNAVQNMDMFEQRTAKIREYQEAGINPFGEAFPRDAGSRDSFCRLLRVAFGFRRSACRHIQLH